ncbi:MAG: triphosphoribosyl-dephospho-CoA synthase [Verrucomicrobiota bacterium]
MIGEGGEGFRPFLRCLKSARIRRYWRGGGYPGWRFARSQARRFLRRGGIVEPGWKTLAEKIHRGFVIRHLTAGGAADLLAATLFIHDLNPER